MIVDCMLWVDIKGALCSFVEATLTRKDQSSLTDFFLPKQTR